MSVIDRSQSDIYQFYFTKKNSVMGDCASTQQTVTPIISNKQLPGDSKNNSSITHQCSQHNIYDPNPEIPLEQPPPKDTNFSVLVLNTILTQFVDLDRDEKQAIFEGVESLSFQPMQYFGGIKISNKETCISILAQDNIDLMVSAGFGVGRSVAVAHQHIFKEYLVKDKNWIIFLRNIIKWLTKNRQFSPQKPIRILIVAIAQLSKINRELARASVFVQINYEQKITGVDLSQYDCIFMYDLVNKYFGNQECSKVTEYVRGGGGLLMALRGWNYKSYGQGKSMKNWVTDSCYNKILSPMGLTFTEESATLQSIKLTPSKAIILAEPQTKPYTKQLNPQFVFEFDEKQFTSLIQLQNKLLEGAGDFDFGKDQLSSFNFAGKSYISVLKQYGYDICVAGNFGKGKILAFGHWSIFFFLSTKTSALQKFVLNTLNWMTGNKTSLEVGLLFQKGQWDTKMKWQLITPDRNITFKIIQQPEDLLSLDILCVGHYKTYPKNLNESFMSKLKQYVNNGGNLVFGSHSWAWQTEGEYKDNKNLVFEKDFAPYAILINFGITLNQHKITPRKPYSFIQNKFDLTIKNFLKNDLLQILKDSSKAQFSTHPKRVTDYCEQISKLKPHQFAAVCPIELYHQLVDAFIQSRFNIEKNYQTISLTENLSCQIFDLMNDISLACPPHICRALPPSLNKYPGYATLKSKQKQIQVYKNRNRTVFTGLYLNPGEVAKVKHKHKETQLLNVGLKINFNEDVLWYPNAKAKRFPKLSRTYKIQQNQFLIASPHGGIIYFQVTGKSEQKNPLIFTIEGAYEMPYWREDTHSYADFQKIKKINAPMFVIQTKRINLIGPTFGILSQLNIKIERLSKFWNKVIGIYKDYSALDQYPFVKDTIFSDVNLTRASMHSGDPLMTLDNFTFQILGVGQKLYTNPTWGLYHQLGHNHQCNRWTTIHTAQVTCNTFVLYLNYKMHGISIAQTLWIERKLEQSVKKHFQKMSRDQSDFNVDNFLGLTFFAILMEQLGYEIFGQLNKTYNTAVLSGVEYYDVIVEQLSMITQHNLWYYFKKWGMPVTPESLQKVKKLHKYKCKRFPFITND